MLIASDLRPVGSAMGRADVGSEASYCRSDHRHQSHVCQAPGQLIAATCGTSRAARRRRRRCRGRDTPHALIEECALDEKKPKRNRLTARTAVLIFPPTTGLAHPN